MYSNLGNSSINYFREHYMNNALSALEDIDMRNSIFLAQNGDLYSRNKIIESMLLYITKKAHDLVRPGFEEDDLVQIGILGCIKAIDTYNLDFDYKFITYADKCICNKMRQFMRDNKRYQESYHYNRPCIDEDDASEFIDFMKDPNSTSFIEEIEDSLIYNQILNLVEKLPSREKFIIEYYFGINGKPQMRQIELQTGLGLSQSYISKIINKVLKEIRKTLQL